MKCVKLDLLNPPAKKRPVASNKKNSTIMKTKH